MRKGIMTSSRILYVQVDTGFGFSYYNQGVVPIKVMMKFIVFVCAHSVRDCWHFWAFVVNYWQYLAQGWLVTC